MNRYDGPLGLFADLRVDSNNSLGSITFGSDGDLYLASSKSLIIERFDGTTGAHVDDLMN